MRFPVRTAGLPAPHLLSILTKHSPLEALQPAQQAVGGAARAKSYRVDGFPILVHGADIQHALAVAAHQDDRQFAVRIIQGLKLTVILMGSDRKSVLYVGTMD